MITYSIIAAQNSNLFDKIYVSSEDSVVIEISRKYGAEIIKRPKKLSDDFTPTIPVIRHAIEWMTENDIYPDLSNDDQEMAINSLFLHINA